jgi:hypothetical protein
LKKGNDVRTGQSSWLGWLLICCGSVGVIWALVQFVPEMKAAAKPINQLVISVRLSKFPFFLFFCEKKLN